MCSCIAFIYFCRTIVTKWTVGRDDGHQLQVRADKRKVQGAVLIYCPRQQADHQGTQVVHVFSLFGGKGGAVCLRGASHPPLSWID